MGMVGVRRGCVYAHGDMCGTAMLVLVLHVRTFGVDLQSEDK